MQDVLQTLRRETEAAMDLGKWEVKQRHWRTDRWSPCVHPFIYLFIFSRSRLNIFKGKMMIAIVLKPGDSGAGDCGVGNNGWDKTAVKLRQTNEVSIKLHRDLCPRPTGSFCTQRRWALGHILADCGQECIKCWKWFILFLWPPLQLRLVLFKWSQLAGDKYVFFSLICIVLIFIHLKVHKTWLLDLKL